MKFPVKKSLLTMLAAMLLIFPAAGMAQGLPEFAQAMQQGISDGLKQGAAQAAAMMDEDLTLSMQTDAPRLEAGQGVTLKLLAGNPKPQEMAVTITLKLPGRVACDGETVWQATLPAATVDAQTGGIVPSVTAFERVLTIADEGESEEVTLEAELGVGTRFYRASTPLALCLPDVSTSAAIEGAEDGRIQPGMAYAYNVTIENAGAAAEAMPVELILPDGVQAVGALPMGFALEGSSITGEVMAVAADADGQPSSLTLTFPVRVADDALANDADATKLLSGILRVGGERVPLPRLQACGPMISAKLIADAQSVEAGEAMTLRVMVLNSGLAGADVRVRCALPDGLTMKTGGADAAEAEEKTQDEAQTEGKAEQAQEDSAKKTEDEQDERQEAPVLPADGGDLPGAGEPAAAVSGGELIYDVHMEPASEHEGGILASTRVIEIPVVATQAMDEVDEKLLGATLAWSVGGGEAQLGEAVAVRVYKPQILGIEPEQWTGILWAAGLMTVTVIAMFFALRGKDDKEDYVFE